MKMVKYLKEWLPEIMAQFVMTVGIFTVFLSHDLWLKGLGIFFVALAGNAQGINFAHRNK